MKIIKRKTVYKGKFLSVVEKDFLTDEGKKGAWECVKRNNAVFIFALTKKKEVILEKIFRIPIESFVISMPAGLMDRKKESLRVAARRELLEETGYLAKRLIPVFRFPQNAGVLMEEGIVFFASGAEYTGQKNLEGGEEIETIKVPLSKLVDFLLNPPPKTKVDIKIFSLLPILQKKGLI